MVMRHEHQNMRDTCRALQYALDKQGRRRLRRRGRNPPDHDAAAQHEEERDLPMLRQPPARRRTGAPLRPRSANISRRPAHERSVGQSTPAVSSRPNPSSAPWRPDGPRQGRRDAAHPGSHAAPAAAHPRSRRLPPRQRPSATTARSRSGFASDDGPGLSHDDTPPFSAPLRFFLTAPLFGVVAGLTLLFGGEILVSRWTPGALAITHLFRRLHVAR